MHRLSEMDTEARTAVCSVDGPVRIRPHGRDRWRCEVKNRETKRRDKMHFKYGVNWRVIDAMLIAQSGRCAICDDPMRVPYVDHCHDTGRVRSLLCRHCNWGLGHFRDRPDLLRAAIAYLES